MINRKGFFATLAGVFLLVPPQLLSNGIPPPGDLWYACIKDGGKIYGLTMVPPPECGPGDSEITLTAGDLNQTVNFLRSEINALFALVQSLNAQLEIRVEQLEDLEIVSLNVNVYTIVGGVPIWIWEVPVSHGVESIELLGELPYAEFWKITFDRENVSDCVFTGTSEPFGKSSGFDFNTRFAIITENDAGLAWAYGPNEILIGSTACGEGPPCEDTGFTLVGRCGTPDDPPVGPTP